MDVTPKALAAVVIAMMVIGALFASVSNVVGEQGDNVADQGGNINEGLDCLFSNKGSANEKCIEHSESEDESDGG